MMSHYAVHTPLQGKGKKISRYEKVPKEKRQGNRSTPRWSKAWMTASLVSCARYVI